MHALQRHACDLVSLVEDLHQRNSMDSELAELMEELHTVKWDMERMRRSLIEFKELKHRRLDVLGRLGAARAKMPACVGELDIQMLKLIDGCTGIARDCSQLSCEMVRRGSMHAVNHAGGMTCRMPAHSQAPLVAAVREGLGRGKEARTHPSTAVHEDQQTAKRAHAGMQRAGSGYLPCRES